MQGKVHYKSHKNSIIPDSVQCFKEDTDNLNGAEIELNSDKIDNRHD